MAYAPGVNDISGQLLAAGIGGAADRISEGIDKYRLTAKEISHLKGATEFAAQQGLLSPEDLAAFEGGNLAKKREIGIRAGMLYSDAQEKEKMMLQKAELEALNAYRMGSLGLQGRQLAMSEAEQAAILPEKVKQMRLSAANAAVMGPLEVANIKARTARTEAETNAFTDPLQAPAFDPARDVFPIPGTNYFGLRSPATGGISPIPRAGAGGPAFAPTEHDKAVAKEAGYAYVPGRDGPEPMPIRNGDKAKPLSIGEQSVLESDLAEISRVDNSIAEHADQIVKGDYRYGLNLFDRADEVRRLQREKAEKVEKLKRKGFNPDGSRIGGGAGAGTAAPATVQGADASGTPVALPPLPDEPGALPNLSELPTMTPEQAETLPSGAYFRTTDGRIIRKR